MKIPKIISKQGREYILIKQYERYALYKDMMTESRECFTYDELGVLKEVVKPSKTARKGGVIVF